MIDEPEVKPGKEEKPIETFEQGDEEPGATEESKTA